MKYLLNHKNIIPPFLNILVVMLMLLSGRSVVAGPYTNSAHGNASYGVDRSSIDPSYSNSTFARGNCAHCHEQHASLNGAEPSPAGGAPSDYLLFYDNFVNRFDMFCYECHGKPSPVVENYCYSYNFGGDVNQRFWSIKKQFCAPVECSSRHNLQDIQNFIKNPAFGWGFGSNPNPCVACHNPHTAQRNHPVAIEGSKLNTAIRRPSHYNSLRPEDLLWGDDEGERMSDYADTYQAPFYRSPTFEPANNSTSDGSNLPDYVTFCTDCHNAQNTIYSSTLGRVLYKIDWSSNGDKHGARNAGDVGPWGNEEDKFDGGVNPPYIDQQKDAGYNYILSCTDCHEPHGSRGKSYLLRRYVNGGVVDPDPTGACDSAPWDGFCTRCHWYGGGGHPRPGMPCIGCHFHGSKVPSGYINF